MDKSDILSSWCAFAPEKEAWKRSGNFFTAEELQQMDGANDISIYQPNERVFSAD